MRLSKTIRNSLLNDRQPNKNQPQIFLVERTHTSEFIKNMKQCTKCSLANNRTQVVVGDYGPKGGMCFIGEGPGYYEDIQGRPFVGRSGKLLDKMLENVGFSRSDVSVLNIVKCRPPNNRDPTPQEQQICSQNWLQIQLKYLEPTLIIPLGRVAFNYFIPRKSITRSKAQLMFSKSGQPIFPLFHPSYVLRNGKQMEQAYNKDFAALIEVYRKLKNESEYKTPKDNDMNIEQSSLEDFFG